MYNDLFLLEFAQSGRFVKKLEKTGGDSVVQSILKWAGQTPRQRHAKRLLKLKNAYGYDEDKLKRLAYANWQLHHPGTKPTNEQLIEIIKKLLKDRNTEISHSWTTFF